MSKITRGWPPKRRQEQAKRCRKNKPWQHNTGPTTKEGKESASQNALKHGLRSEDGIELRRLMHRQRLLVNAILKMEEYPE